MAVTGVGEAEDTSEMRKPEEDTSEMRNPELFWLSGSWQGGRSEMLL